MADDFKTGATKIILPLVERKPTLYFSQDTLFKFVENTYIKSCDALKNISKV
jgi:hypothetical protein